MEHTTQLSHRSAIFTISASRLFERAAYYGLRAIVVLYMITEAFDSGSFSSTEAIQIYAIFTGALVFTQIVGALIGDFLVGNKTSMVIGVFVQALGAFALSIPSAPFLFGGLGLVLIGGGLYSPNVLALFAKQYGDRKRLADSGFMFFYIAINIGATFGIFLLSYLNEGFGFSLGFIASGILFLCAGVLAILSKDDKEIPDEDLGVSVPVRTLNVFAVIATTGLFWWLYELFGSRTYEVQAQLSDIVDNPITTEMWQQLNPLAILLGGIILFFIWSRVYTSLYIKVAIGFAVSAFAMLLLYLFPPASNTSHIALFGGIMLLFAVAELFISPAVLTVVARYVNPKYMAVAMSATFIPGLFFKSVSSLLGEVIYSNQEVVLLAGLVIAVLVGIGMFVLNFLIREEAE